MFTLTLKKSLSISAMVVSLITFSQSATAQQFELKNNNIQSMQKARQSQGISPAFSARKDEGSKITAKCWTVSECSQMISDCASVNGWFHSGITDPTNGATSEGSCTL